MTRFASNFQFARGLLASLLIAVAIGSAARADDGTVSADDLSFEAGGSTYTIKHLEASGTSLSAADLKALFNGIGKTTGASDLAKLEAKSIVIPEMTAQTTVAGTTSMIRYQDIKLSDIHAGKVGSYTIALGDISGQIATGEDLKGEMRGIAGADVDLPGLVHVFADSNPEGDAPLARLYGKSSIDSYKFSSNKFEFTIGKTSFDDVRGRPLKVSLADLLRKLPKPPVPGQNMAPEDEKAHKAFLSGILEVYSAFSFASLDLHDMKFGIAANPALNQPAVTVGIANYQIENYGPKGVGATQLEGFTVVFPKGKFAIGSYTVKDMIRSEGYGKALANFIDMLPISPPKPGAENAAATQKLGLAAITSMIDIYSNLSIGQVDLRDVAFEMENPAQHGDPISVSLARWGLGNLDKGRLGDFSIEGFKLAAPDNKAKLGKFSITGLDFRDWMTSMGTMMKAMVDDPAGLTDAATKVKRISIEGVALADLDVNMTVPPTPGDPQGKGPMPVVFSLAAANIKPVMGNGGQTFRSLTSSLDHLNFKLPPGTPNLDTVTAAGIDTFDVSSKLDAQWDEAKQQFNIGTMAVTDPNLGALQLSATADNVPPEAFSGDQFMMQAAWLGALLKSVDIKIDNRKALDLILAAQAKQSGKPADQAKSELILAAAAGIPAALGNSPASKALGDAIAKFLANPKSLHIAASSKDGIGVGDAAAPNLILDKLDLTAKANE